MFFGYTPGQIRAFGSKCVVFWVVWGLLVFVVSCSGGWPEDERKIFLEQCRNGAMGQGATDADKHCGCMLAKLEAAYPNPEDVQRISPTVLMQMAAACQDSASNATPPTDLQAQTRANFMDRCRQMANADARIKDPGSFCECLLNQLMQNPAAATNPGNISPDTLMKMGEKCQ